MNSISCKFHNVYKISFSDNNRANKRQVKFRILKRRYQFLSWKITNHITLHLRNFYKTFSTKFRDMSFFYIKIIIFFIMCTKLVFQIIIALINDR